MIKQYFSKVKAIVAKWLYGIERNNKETKAEKLTKFIEQAQESVWAVVGNINGELWKAKSVVEAMSNAIDRGIEITIIVDKKDVPEDKRIYSLWQNNKIGINYYPNLLSGHYAVIDNSAVRIEEVHPPDQSFGKAWLVPRSAMLGSRLSSDFLETLQYATSLSEVLKKNSESLEVV